MKCIQAILFIIFSGVFITGCGIKTFKNDSDAMSPTLRRGESFIADLKAYDKGQKIKRWDIVVFHPPRYPDRYWAMRIVGLPGETVTIQDGNLFINGEILQLPVRINNIQYSLEPPGVELSTLSHPVVLPSNCFYLLGDNPQAAMDSRYWGPLPKKNIVGKVIK
jgi:signal peptidase I